VAHLEIPRLVIAGTHSGVGKTTVTTALIAALARRGLRVQPFKIGPDFIDPGFHSRACGRPSHNLDGWMLSRDANLEIFARASAGADIAIIEGVMGLFDGRDAASEKGSTAEMAKWLHAPVLLVADGSAMARSAAALLRGFECFDPDLDLAGVLWNRIGGKGHADILREAVEAHCQAAALGFLPRTENISLPERHLGLVMAGEFLDAPRLGEMADWIETGVDLDRLLKLSSDRAPSFEIPSLPQPTTPPGPIARIGLARDAAFCFYYQDNLDLLVESGAELVEFSPMTDAALPAGLDGLYLGGGYPEIHAARLAENRAMREAIYRFLASGAPVYAECGGFMYLTEAIVDTEGREYTMVGLFPARARMQERLAALAYIEAETLGDSLWLRAGERLCGHEFRYSQIDGMAPDIGRCFRLHGSADSRLEGYKMGSVLAGYAHLHFRSAPDFAKRFVRACCRQSQLRSNELTD
jgi:cobyrinic acid a,c-diamide synthase